MSTPSPIGNNDDRPEPSQKDVKPKPTRPKPRTLGFTAQEILMLAQAYMHESLDPINGTSKKADVMWNDICQSYNKLRQAYDRGKIERLSADKPYTPISREDTAFACSSSPNSKAAAAPTRTEVRCKLSSANE